MSSAATAAIERSSTHEYDFTDRHFNLLRELVARHAGITLNDSKRELVYGRLARRIRALGLRGFDDYCALLERDEGAEMGEFINAITTNLTAFFRENHHFDFLAQTAIPEFVKANAASRRLRIWSAGCSTGEEPYSLAMTLLESVPSAERWDIRILATDIDSNVVATAQAGVYGENRLQGVSAARRQQWFTKQDCAAGQFRVKPALQEIIRFAPLNLMHEWPFKGPFDAIFCRNVLIYFDKPTQHRLFERYGQMIANHGYLFIGHSESMFGANTVFELIGRTTYRVNRGAR
ncbi:MAG: protein-glutamate O-methyltransferase CheR [Gammaproteobacteria bacterium]|nr:protein-glutamate O-methyltransferase CheR [Gammaproteobacteria bacterium]